MDVEQYNRCSIRSMEDLYRVWIVTRKKKLDKNKDSYPLKVLKQCQNFVVLLLMTMISFTIEAKSP